MIDDFEYKNFVKEHYLTYSDKEVFEPNVVFDSYKHGADIGIMGCDFCLALCYYYGIGTDIDYDKARQLLDETLEDDNTNALNFLGLMYFTGKYEEIDYDKAASYFLRAASMGNALAKYNLGFTYETGIGNKQIYSKAMKLYEEAANQEEGFGFVGMASCYSNGNGVEKDGIKANELLLNGANMGNAEAQYIYGSRLIRGISIERNEEEGVSWIRKAAEQGYGKAISYLQVRGIAHTESDLD